MDPFGRTYWVYILASKKDGMLYVGVTSDLPGRVYEHRAGLTPGFTSKYGVNRLVYFEMFGVIDEAIAREAVEAMATGLENQADRGGQSRLAGFV